MQMAKLEVASLKELSLDAICHDLNKPGTEGHIEWCEMFHHLSWLREVHYFVQDQKNGVRNEKKGKNLDLALN